jgi:hypothetical protein
MKFRMGKWCGPGLHAGKWKERKRFVKANRGVLDLNLHRKFMRLLSVHAVAEERLREQ